MIYQFYSIKTQNHSDREQSSRSYHDLKVHIYEVRCAQKKFHLNDVNIKYFNQTYNKYIHTQHTHTHMHMIKEVAKGSLRNKSTC